MARYAPKLKIDDGAGAHLSSTFCVEVVARAKL